MACPTCSGIPQPVLKRTPCVDCGECGSNMDQSCPTDAKCESTTIYSTSAECPTEEAPDSCDTIVDTELFEEEECTKARDVLQTATDMTDTNIVCPTVPEEYLRLLQYAVRSLNKEPWVYKVREAVLQKCGVCEYQLPKDVNRIFKLTNDIEGCNPTCNTRVYEQVNPEDFEGSPIVNVFVHENDKIKIHTPQNCGCSEGIPDYLKVYYYGTIKSPKSMDDCMDITDDEFNLLVDKLIAESLGIKFNNIDAVNAAIARLTDYERKNRTALHRHSIGSSYSQIQTTFGIG